MSRESFWLTLFRILALCLVVFFLGMLYWSNSLIEEDLKSVQAQLHDLRSEFQSLGSDLREKSFSSSQSLTNNTSSTRPQMNEKYPNLLEVDTFYTETLPKLLGDNFRPSGIRQEAILGHPEHLHPFNNFRDVRNFYSLCSAAVAELQFGKYETMAPALAIKMEERPTKANPKATEFWIHLRENVFWQPLKDQHFPANLHLAEHFKKKHSLSAYDFKFYLDAIMNPNISEPAAAALRTYYSDIEEFRVIDDLTFVVRWKTSTEVVDGITEEKVKYSAKSLTGGLQPLPRFVYQYFSDGTKIIDNDANPDIYRTDSIWAQNFIQHWAKNTIVSCGAWIFDGFSDQSIRFVRNPNYFKPLAALSSELHFYFKESFEGIWQDFKAGKIDLCNIAPSQLPELEAFLKSSGYQAQKFNEDWIVEQLDYVNRSFTYMGLNQTSPFFKERKVRQALTMAIDRNRIIEQNLNQLGVAISGPLFRYSPAYDSTLEDWPYDPLEAKKYLEEEGWIDKNGDGIRDKLINGQWVPFSFSLTYYVKNLSTKVIAEYIQIALKEVGIECRLNGVDVADISHAFEDKSFDAIILAWGFGTPPDDPRQIWHSSGATEKGSSNGIGFSNKEVDAIIEKLNYEYDKNKRIQLYHQFHAIIHEEAPYIFLYSPINKLLYRNYLKNVFIPMKRQDLIPGADISEPDLSVSYIVPHPEL